MPVGRGSFTLETLPKESDKAWYRSLKRRYEAVEAKHPKVAGAKGKSAALQIGTLGGGNHFVELCLDEAPDLSPHPPLGNS